MHYFYNNIDYSSNDLLPKKWSNETIVIPTAPELIHEGRDWSCYDNLDISTLNKAT